MNRKPHILLVEDDKAFSQAYQTRMEAEGFEVKLCQNGQEALSTAISFKPDLILLDIMMPRISGFDVLDILRNTPETAASKIVVLSALGQPSDKQKAMAAGADDYLVKAQAVITDVMTRIRQHLNLPEPADKAEASG